MPQNHYRSTTRLHLGTSFSVFLSTIYFLLWANQPYVTTPMITHFKFRAKIQILSLGSWSRISQKHVNGSMKTDICHFLPLGFQDAQPNSFYDNITIKNFFEEKILGITTDNNLTFKSRLKNICKETNRKFNALVRITNFTSLFQRKTLLNSFFKLQFSNYPLPWMFSF